MSPQLHRSFVVLAKLALLALLIPHPVLGSCGAKGQGDVILVYGDDFVFGAREPSGWTGDCSQAERFHTNMVFFPQAEESKASDMSIRIRVNTKHGEDMAVDLAADMEGYRKEFPRVQFEDLAVRHPKYATFPKLFFEASKWYEYVAYLNPGPRYPHVFSVAMSKQGKPANESELAAFRQVLESITAVNVARINGDQEAAETSPALTAAAQAVKANEATAEGARYDQLFGERSGVWLQPLLKQCTKGLSDEDLKPFDAYVRVSASGAAEEVLVTPDTKVAHCVRAELLRVKYPIPPRPSWWVKLGITII